MRGGLSSSTRSGCCRPQPSTVGWGFRSTQQRDDPYERHASPVRATDSGRDRSRRTQSRNVPRWCRYWLGQKVPWRALSKTSPRRLEAPGANEKGPYRAHGSRSRRTARRPNPRRSGDSVRGERRDSNPRPPGPQPGALPAELRPPRGSQCSGPVARPFGEARLRSGFELGGGPVAGAAEGAGAGDDDQRDRGTSRADEALAEGDEPDQSPRPQARGSSARRRCRRGGGAAPRSRASRGSPS